MTAATWWRGAAVYNGRPCVVTGKWCGYVVVRCDGEDFSRCVVEGDELRSAAEAAKSEAVLNSVDEGRRR